MTGSLSPNQKGALLMLGSMAFFTFNDTLVKLVGETVPLWQIVTIRGVLASLLLAGLARAMGALRFDFSRRDWALVLARCATEMAATYFFLSALLQLPLANVTAVLQILPLTVTLCAALFLGESVGWRRSLAIGVGFVGMLLIVRPGGADFGPATIYALLAVAVLTLRDLVTRKMSPAVPSLTVTFLAAFSVMLFGIGLGVGESWQPVGLREWGLLCATAVLILLAYLSAVMTIRVGEVSAVAPLRYTGLVWALLLGWVVFGEFPSGLTLLGAGIVVAAGLFTLLRERQVAENT
ncbi:MULTISPECIES: DMT family transporter [unclassified Epibacterium]|jgi:drug/metabolite transporter (DMT)-like permease|uniref:DMT family transporter n=1 Tax=unclassified Epibacterium TaxID=2639179 RepID=UPI001EF6816B|nr:MULTISPECIES: DMT family transporter [unclassified Epibacterium]MCG7626106.1 DMT family transporter [Epibacterium sp. Ofav1-8]MCG7630581.1 DMT family transporter [Epibacterium sp. MM17-32]